MKCTGLNCPMQKEYIDPAICKVASNCFYATFALTNSDYLRRMSDEELAKRLAERSFPLCPPRDEGCLGNGCYSCWLDWLKEEKKIKNDP